MLLAPGSHLAKHHDRHARILVSRVGSCQTAVALLQSEYIVIGMLLFEELDLLSDILKSGQHLDQLHVVGCRNRFCHIGRHDRLHERRVLRHGSHRLLLS